jgi:predicted ATP-binding protein involved in virulence
VFPRCQFIATTHSPQIVAAVEPEQVLLLTDAGVVRPDRTLGMDSNWILRHLMETDDRPAGAAKAIRSVEALIKRGTFTKARTAIAEAKKNGFDLPEWSVLEARMARLEVFAQ